MAAAGRAGLTAALVLAGALSAPAAAQRADLLPSAVVDTLRAPAPLQTLPRRFSWPRFAAGFFASLAAHEAAHLVTAWAVGGRPSIGFDGPRPVMYSGIDPLARPASQFAFSASGMAVQLLMNEAILDWPHGHGGVAGEFERGVLAGGIGTVLFYVTVGRASSVGDMDHMARASGLSKWWLTAIFGGVAASDVLRVALGRRYVHLFAFPGEGGALHVGATAAF